ncbi:hypothetical protein BCV70DRAFT_193995 [Testicularia cyperi]|uniref:P-loop containing nucleoside triphosphate hydrolase protein n=1 Tax=Testicularia cyperi TaxID=1882483 RepID=A0A317XI84_9BASI|nr:hypothetical protein BCV70DRAFT_193995 [Testicularia cyperi]
MTLLARVTLRRSTSSKRIHGHSSSRISIPAILDYFSPFVTNADVLEHNRIRSARDSDSKIRHPHNSSSTIHDDSHAFDGFRRQRGRNLKLLVVVLAQALTHTTSAAFQLVDVDASSSALASSSVAIAWVYILLSVLLRPPQTPRFSLVLLVFLLLVNALVDLLSLVPLLTSSHGPLRLHFFLHTQVLLCLLDNILIVCAAALLLQAPIAPGGYEAVVDLDERIRNQGTQSHPLPSSQDDMAETYRRCPTSPEDFCSLYENLSYSWMAPIQSLALRRPLVPTDVWRLRSINDTRLLFRKFQALDTVATKDSKQHPRLLAKIVRANANDILLDAFFKLIAVSFAYLGAYILKSILDEIQLAALEDQNGGSTVDPPDGPHWTPRQRAFVYAFIGVCLTVIRFLAELQNFHHARQVGLRLRSTLVVSLFEKALKRRDLSGQTKTATPSSATETKPDAQQDADISSDDIIQVQSASSSPVIPQSESQDNQQAPRDANLLNVPPATADPPSQRSWTDSLRGLGRLHKVSFGSLRSAASSRRGKARQEKRQARAAEALKKQEEQRGADVGKVVNMMASDVNILLRMGCDLHQLYGAPFEVTIAAIFLYKLMGWSALVGFAILVAAIPVNYLWGEIAVKKQREYSSARDVRMSLMTELVNAMRFVKIQGVERRWEERVTEARRNEIGRLIRSRIMTFLFELLWTTIPVSVTLVSFFFYVKVAKEELTVSTAFTALALFTMIRPPLNAIPGFLMGGLIALVSIQRLESFLTEEEVDDAVSQLSQRWSVEASSSRYRDQEEDSEGNSTDADNVNASSRLAIRNGSFRWHRPASAQSKSKKNAARTDDTNIERDFCLQDIHVDFPAGKLSLVVGPTGSGKSSMLAALLGEMLEISADGGSGGTSSVERTKFDRRGRSRISFASQLPWLESGKSVRDNIVFTSAYDPERYSVCIHACALEDDLATMEDGDQTRIGAHTVSGGQKARISLARALYAFSDTVLLDDVLSAVDTRVQNHIVRHALQGKIARGRRIVLVTHHAHLLLDSAALLVHMHDGRISHQGSPAELEERGLMTRLGLKHDSSATPSSSSSASLSTAGKAVKSDAGDEGLKPRATAGTATPTPTDGRKPAADGTVSGARTPRLLYQDEKRREGAVSWIFYKTYLKASSLIAWGMLVLLLLLLRSADSFGQYWLKVWGEAYNRSTWETGSKLPFLRLPPAEGHADFYLTVYGLTGAAIVLLNSSRSICFYVASIQASQSLFAKLLANVVRAPLRWFDITPAGRIMNRFGTDMDCVDNVLPQSIMNLGNNAFSIAAYFLICVAIVPAFLLPTAALVLLGPWLVGGFLACTRDMQRIEATSTSPIYGHFQQALSGIMTIRAFGAEPRMLEALLDAVDLYQSLWWAVCTMEVWLSFRSQILGGVSVFVVTLLALSGAVSPGSAGLALSSAQLLCQLAYYLVNDFKNLANSFNSLERISEYQTMEREEDDDTRARYSVAGAVPAAWPSASGSVVFEDIRLRYAPELPDVLKGVSFEIRPGEKVGVIGRTGSGKSSLASSLFRATELSGGRILIDGIDISTVPLHELRNRLSIVMQDPVLFSGTLRENLDPFNEHSDAQVLDALRKVEDPTDASMPDGQSSSRLNLRLDTPISSGGANFSAGQAQLISLARSLLRTTRILILDEATSSTDMKTDAMIQRVIRSALDGCIVLCIAHRLRSVIDYDRVLVMQDGNLVEFGTPKELLSKSDDDATAHFKDLCRHSAEYQELCSAAGVTPT